MGDEFFLRRLGNEGAREKVRPALAIDYCARMDGRRASVGLCRPAINDFAVQGGGAGPSVLATQFTTSSSVTGFPAACSSVAIAGVSATRSCSSIANKG